MTDPVARTRELLALGVQPSSTLLADLVAGVEAERERTRHWRECAAVYKRERDELADACEAKDAEIERLRLKLRGLRFAITAMADERGEG